MKNLILLTFGLFAFAQLDAQVSVTDNKVEAVITPEITRSGLWDIVVQLRDHGLEMRYDQIEWIDGQLTSINLRVKGESTGVAEYMTGDLPAVGQIRVVFRNDEAPESALCVSPSCE